MRDPLAFFPGAQLLVRERSSATAEDVDITPAILDVYAAAESLPDAELAIDIKDLESSYDGATLVFAARIVPLPVDNNLENSSWDLWQLDLATLQPSYVIPSRLKRNEGLEAGGGHDIAPFFLGDDRILFSSTRQVGSQSRLLNEGRSQIFSALDEDRATPAAVLHIYDPEQQDAEFTQLSYNRSHDLDPILTAAGEIVFSRWNNTSGSHISLFRMHPSGSELSTLYGFHSQNSGTNGAAVEFSQPRETEQGSIISVLKPFANPLLGGDIIVLDSDNFVDAYQPTWANQGDTGSGQQALHQQEVRTDESLSPGGLYASVYPLYDGTNRSLVSWSPCRVVADNGTNQPCSQATDNTQAAPPLYGAWVYNPAEDTQRPVVLAEEGFWISEVIAAEPRQYPAIAPRRSSPDGASAQAGMGHLLIDSVYDYDGRDFSPAGIANHALPGSDDFRDRPARFLRFIYAVPLPDDEVIDIPNFAAGVAGNGNFREIAGYVPVEPDGSVTATIPADRAFSFSVLDARARRIGPRHNFWLQAGAGEVIHCSGCHDQRDQLPHGRIDSQPASANQGAVTLTDGGLGFPATDPNLYAVEPGQTMAQIWDYQRSPADSPLLGRSIELHPEYQDEWSPATVTADPTIANLAYEDWPDLDPAYPLLVNNLDPALPPRIVINYLDHIQPIWERQRNPVLDASAVAFDSCVGCHSSESNSRVAAGQLDLESTTSDIDPDHVRSYRELLSRDNEQWLDSGGNLADRLRICTELDEEGNVLSFSEPVSVGSPMRGGNANGSARFFNCFEGGNCGPPAAAPPAENCTEEGGTVVPATNNTVDHRDMLSPAELRLISEWLDIGAQYYNNPFDARLQ